MEKDKILGQNQIIVVFGPPGSGKTVLSGKLAQCWSSHEEFGRRVILLSADAVEHYLNTHSIQSLDSFLKDKLAGTGKAAFFVDLTSSLQSSVNTNNSYGFSPEIWKISRHYIRNQLDTFLSNPVPGTLIIQDDFLLNSTRKSFRQYAQSHETKYVEVCMRTCLEKCIENDLARGKKVGEAVITDKFKKFETNSFTIEVDWGYVMADVEQKLRTALIDYKPRVQISQPVDQPVPISDKQLTEIKARRLISQIMQDPARFKQFFGQSNISRAAASKLLSKAKSSFKWEAGFQKFREYLQKEISANNLKT